MTTAELHPLISSLSQRDTLSDEEKALIVELPRTLRSFRRGQEIVSAHSRPKHSCVILEGFAARCVFTGEGRQISALHMVGDFIDLHSLLLKTMDHSVLALTDCRCAFISHRDLIQLSEQAPHLGRLLWLSTVIDGAIQRTWIASLGRRSAITHLAHLLCELYMRLEAVGLATEGRFDFPVPQAELADVLGLSLVHVNRTLQDLRAKGLITWQGSTVTIVDFNKLARFADFEPTYLNLVREPR